jgi:hypothetical protein
LGLSLTLFILRLLLTASLNKFLVVGVEGGTTMLDLIGDLDLDVIASRGNLVHRWVAMDHNHLPVD